MWVISMDDDQVVASVADTSIEEPTSTTSTVEENQPEVQSDNATSAVNDGQEESTDGQEIQNETPKSVPYERFSERVNKLKNELKEAKQKAELWDKLQSNPELAESTLRLISQNTPKIQDPVLRQADQQLREMGYVPAQDVIKTVERLVDQKLNMSFAQREFVGKMQGLEKTYNGQDGNPKFEAQKVAQFMDKTGISDPEQAYKVMYLDNLTDNKAKQKRGTPFTERQGAPMSSNTDVKKADFENAKKSGDWEGYLEKYVTPKK